MSKRIVLKINFLFIKESPNSKMWYINIMEKNNSSVRECVLPLIEII